MVTIKDVAKLAGVSISTVSRVINNSCVVSDESRRRVEDAIVEVGYQPNLLARDLRRRQTQSIGLIVPDIANPFFAEIARSIEDFSFDKEYSVVLCNSGSDPEKQTLYTNLLIQSQVAGIILVAAGADKDLVDGLCRRRIPLIVVDRAIANVKVNAVMTNHCQGGWLATQHLIELGHCHIACISAGPDLSPSTNRLTGYLKALRQNSIDVPKDLIVPGNFQYAGGYQAANKLLDLAKPPTAIFASNDLMAIGCIRAAMERGLRVPDDLSVVGFDDIELASFISPALTTVAQPKREIGVLAVKMLVDCIENIDAPIRTEQLDTKLVVRRSTTIPHKPKE